MKALLCVSAGLVVGYYIGNHYDFEFKLEEKEII